MKFASLWNIAPREDSRAPQGARGLKYTEEQKMSYVANIVAPRKGRVG
mgnify:CR=1 FL=1